MKVFLVFLVSAFFIVSISAQEVSTIRVLGEHRVQHEPTAWAMTITLSEDPSLCDPIKGFMSLDQQLQGFILALSNIGLTSYSLTEVPLLSKKAFPRRKHEFRTKDPKVAYALRRLAKEANVNPEIYFIYEGLGYEEEDKRAFAAFQNAEEQALAIASSEGYSSLRLLSIDDDTIGGDCASCFEFSSSSKNDWHVQDFLNLLASFSKERKLESGTIQSPERIYESIYHLWVEFEVIP